MVKTSSFNMSLTLVVGIVLGMLVDCFVDERTPQIQAAAPRPTLDSLQAEVDSIISGSILVGKAADAAVAHSLTNSSDPATQANAGAIRFNGGDVQYSDGTRWVTVSAVDDPVVLEVATSRPTAPFVGETILNTTTGKVETWNGSFWMQLN